MAGNAPTLNRQNGMTDRERRTLSFVLAWALLLGMVMALRSINPDGGGFPERLVWGLKAPLDEFQSWVIGNRTTHWLFVYGFDPASRLLDTWLRGVEGFLLALPWTVVVVALCAIAYKSVGRAVSAFTALALILIGMFGLWDATMKTLALMGVAVFITLLIGIPVGILAARYRRFGSILRPVLDAMQVMPAFVYLIPVLLFFGIARVPSVVATVIYALPPAVRMTTLGIRQVPKAATEAADAFGSTSWQKLRKVQLPVAMPTILLGVNQTTMMALGIVVIAAMIGAGGLGENVLKGLQRQDVGRALEAGLAIVLIAMMFDRISAGMARESRRAMLHSAPRKQSGVPRWLSLYFFWSTVLLVLLILTFLSFSFPALAEFPTALHVSIAAPVNSGVDWMRDNLYQIGNTPLGTGSFSDFVVIHVLNPVRAFLLGLPWIVLLFAGLILGTQSGGLRLGLLVASCIYALGGLNTWNESMDTLSQVFVAVLITLSIGIPLGIGAARYRSFERLLRPFLDFLQTIPPFVYLVPVIILFNPGRVPGVIASVLYALPPITRLTTLGIRQVPLNTTEAARAFGSTSGQMLRKVQLPLAMPSIMMGLNQTVMMVLSMVIIAGLVGGGALGFEAVLGLARSDLGRGMEAGLAIVALAIMLDRLTQAWARNSRFGGPADE
jgi:glycine betaine/proline transport system permease protein